MRRTWLTVLAVAGLLLAGCGSDDGVGGAAARSEPTTTTTAAPPMPTPTSVVPRLTPLDVVGGPMYTSGAVLVAGDVGSTLPAFERRMEELGLGPVRIAWQDGDYLAVTEDLMVGRVNVAVAARDGSLFVVDAFVEHLSGTAGGVPEATIVVVFEDVEFYPACGNEPLEHGGFTWYQVHQGEHPEVYARTVEAYRENIPEDVAAQGFAPHGFAARVAPPGPGDDIGTLVVWSDDVAWFVSDNGNYHAWLVREELTYGWEC